MSTVDQSSQLEILIFYHYQVLREGLLRIAAHREMLHYPVLRVALLALLEDSKLQLAALGRRAKPPYERPFWITLSLPYLRQLPQEEPLVWLGVMLGWEKWLQQQGASLPSTSLEATLAKKSLASGHAHQLELGQLQHSWLVTGREVEIVGFGLD